MLNLSELCQLASVLGVGTVAASVAVAAYKNKYSKKENFDAAAQFYEAYKTNNGFLLQAAYLALTGKEPPEPECIRYLYELKSDNFRRLHRYSRCSSHCEWLGNGFKLKDPNMFKVLRFIDRCGLCLGFALIFLGAFACGVLKMGPPSYAFGVVLMLVGTCLVFVTGRALENKNDAALLTENKA
jgi:hypothetical protein